MRDYHNIGTLQCVRWIIFERENAGEPFVFWKVLFSEDEKKPKKQLSGRDKNKQHMEWRENILSLLGTLAECMWYLKSCICKGFSLQEGAAIFACSSVQLHSKNNWKFVEIKCEKPQFLGLLGMSRARTIDEEEDNVSMHHFYSLGEVQQLWKQPTTIPSHLLGFIILPFALV